jgi:enoyl-CoA hydratase/carnithine racemase
MIDLERESGIARIFLNRPEKVNALNSQMLDALAAELEGLTSDQRLRVVVLGGRGKVFCAGADVGELAALNESTAPAFVGRVHRVCAALRALAVPVVARLHGVVIGAGLEIAAACDLRIAAKGTRFAMPEVKLGIPSVVEAALLPRLMGSGRAAWLVLTGEAIDAERAYEWGLVEEPTEELDQTVARVVQSLVEADRQALRLQKELLQLWEEAPLARSIDASLARFAEAYAGGVPPALRRHTISRA